MAFADPSVGKLELIVSPLEKFTPKKKVRIQDLGNPKFLIGRIGNFITGAAPSSILTKLVQIVGSCGR